MYCCTLFALNDFFFLLLLSKQKCLLADFLHAQTLFCFHGWRHTWFSQWIPSYNSALLVLLGLTAVTIFFKTRRFSEESVVALWQMNITKVLL